MEKDRNVENKGYLKAIMIISNILLLAILLILSIIKQSYALWVIFGFCSVGTIIGWIIKIYQDSSKAENKDKPPEIIEYIPTEQASGFIDYYLSYHKGMILDGSRTVDEGIKNVGEEGKAKTKIYYKKIFCKDINEYIHFALRLDNLEHIIKSGEIDDLDTWLNNLASNPKIEHKRIKEVIHADGRTETVTENVGPQYIYKIKDKESSEENDQEEEIE